MNRQTAIQEAKARRSALDTALDLVDAERTKATNARVEAERAIMHADHWRRKCLAARRPRNIETHAIAYGLGVLSAGLVIWIVGVAL